MDTYCSQLKIVTKEKADLDKNHLKLQESLKKSEKQAMKAMELDASVICLRENEKLAQMKMKKLEEELNVEKKLNTSKDSEISKLTKLLEKAQDRLEEEKNKSFKETENEVNSKKVNELETENNQFHLSTWFGSGCSNAVRVSEIAFKSHGQCVPTGKSFSMVSITKSI